MRALVAIAVALFASLAATAGAANFADSRYLAPIPTDRCDTYLSTSLISSGLLTQMLNDPARRVFCVYPGDYRSAGNILIQQAGTEAKPRIVRFNASDGVANAVQRTQRATFESFYFLKTSWWVMQGLTVRPTRPTTSEYVTLGGSDHVVIDGNLLDGDQHQNPGDVTGVRITGYQGDPATYNTVQHNVIRNGDQSGKADDYWGVIISAATYATERNDYNKVLDNEIYDWGDAVSVAGYTMDCSEPAVQHGTVVDGNDLYVTEAKRVDCTTGARDPNGQCICAENGFDNKSNPGPNVADWTRVTNNRVWGYRPTQTAVHCGGSGSNGQAISSGNLCPGHVFVAKNIVADSTIGISMTGPGWIVAGNLLHDIRTSNGRGIYTLGAILPTQYATSVQIQFNTVVSTDAAYDDQSSYTDTRCNQVIDDAALPGNSGSRGLAHTTEDNFLYHSPQPNFMGNGNAFFPSEGESHNGPFCYWRRRFTAPERICVPYAATEPGSPQASESSTCNEAIGAPFGIESISYVPEPDAGALALAGLGSLATAAALSRRHARRG